MCLSAIIWANIKKVYYGNKKEDAAKIGFRDDDIYSFLNSLNNNLSDSSSLESKLECMDREETIKAFDEFLKIDDKTIY
jgi:tRNA(Arg) A34 adenosine deaminase TadA